jgi:hypothetical protein
MEKKPVTAHSAKERISASQFLFCYASTDHHHPLEGDGEAAGVLSQLFPLTYRSCSDTCRSIRSCL